MTTTFTKKQLRVTLTLTGSGQTFPGTGNNTLVLTALRMSAKIEGAANYANNLELRIYGMAPEDMNALTTLFFGKTQTLIGFATVKVESNDSTGWSQAFIGNITNGSPQYGDGSNVSFLIQGIVAYTPSVGMTDALSYSVAPSVDSVAQKIAQALGISNYKNNGVTAQLPIGSYFPGAPIDQLNALSRAAAFDYYLDNGTLNICPQFFPLQGGQAIELSPTNGLISYPQPAVGGIEFDCYYTPALALATLVKITGSDVPAANGTWMVRAHTHSLDTLLPGGKWESHVVTTVAS